MNQSNLELPTTFQHQPPEGMHYEVTQFNKTVLAIWICYEHQFLYREGEEPPKCIWGFYRKSKGQFYAPINSKKVGSEVDISQTTPYTAMQLNLNPLESAFCN